MFYKVENGVLIPAPKNGLKLFIANPTPEQYALVGYTDKIVEETMPEEVEGKVIESYYEQVDGVIHKKYKYIDIPHEIDV